MSIFRRIGNVISRTALGLALSLPVGCASVGGSIAKTEYSHPGADLKSKETMVYPSKYAANESYEEKRKERGQSTDLEGFISAGFATDYVDRKDFVSDKGPVSEYFFTMNKKNNFVPEDNISTGVLSDESLADGRTLETDLFCRYSFPVDFMKNLSGGYTSETYGDRISAGYEYWNFNSQGKAQQNVGTLGWFHNSRADLDFKYYFPVNQVVDSGLLSFTLSKKVPIKTFGQTTFSLTPNINLCYAHNWQGIDGFGQISPGINLSFERNALSLNLAMKHQNPLSSKIANKNYASLELGFRF